MPVSRFFSSLVASLIAIVSFLPGASAAENLKLRDGISYVHDLDKAFPILADKLDDVRVEAGKPCFIFFGAAGDLNTNRQSKRVVDLYKKYKNRQLKFVVMDVDNPGSAEAKQLIKNYYQGYIPGEVVLDKQGKTVWNHVGEADSEVLFTQVEKVIE